MVINIKQFYMYLLFNWLLESLLFLRPRYFKTIVELLLTLLHTCYFIALRVSFHP